MMLVFPDASRMDYLSPKTHQLLLDYNDSSDAVCNSCGGGNGADGAAVDSSCTWGYADILIKL